ncbi:MAG: hypothetical protein U9Q75_10110 [Pseudomonadota bacterium]|nr:hypothetical protein [Pseudomonadota bacterium]
MNLQSLTFASTPSLSDETVNEIRLFLFKLLIAYEQEYGDQFWSFREYFEAVEQQPDLFDDMEEDVEDEIPF